MRNRKQLKSVLAGVGIASSIAVGNAQSATVPTGGLLLSLRADTHLSISGQTWGDENGGTNRVDTFVGTTPTLSSVTTPNGPHAAINFGGSTEITLNDGNTGGTATGVTTPALNVQNITAYVVGNLTTTQFSEIFLDDFSHNNGWAVGVTDSGNGSANATKWYRGHTGSGSLEGTTAEIMNATDTYEIVMSSTATTATAELVDLTTGATPLVASGTVLPNIAYFGNNDEIAGIGGLDGASNSQALHGNIAEVLVFDNSSQSFDATAVQNYINAEYVTPEPSSLALLGLGGLAALRRRRES